MIEFEGERPIFMQIADGIEDAIISGAFPEETQIPSTTEFSVMYRINPATALKGITMLADDGILYKKRGVGMFVARGACHQLKEKRKVLFYDHYVANLIREAKRLSISETEIKDMIGKGYQTAGNDDGRGEVRE